MSKVNPTYNKTDTGQLPRYQSFFAGLKTKDPELNSILSALERKINRKFQELETRIDVLEGETVDIEFDNTVDTTLTLEIKRGVIHSHNIT